MVNSIGIKCRLIFFVTILTGDGGRKNSLFFVCATLFIHKIKCEKISTFRNYHFVNGGCFKVEWGLRDRLTRKVYKFFIVNPHHEKLGNLG